MNQDWKVPDELVARCMGRLDRVQRVLDAYFAQMGEDISHLATELDAGNTVEVARIAHRIKGASANAAINSLRAEAEAIEQLAHANQFSDIRDCIDRLKDDLQAITESVTRTCSQPLTSTADRV
jgi:HPt (histidine-containing phosphotransfer) domain-containing protein